MFSEGGEGFTPQAQSCLPGLPGLTLPGKNVKMVIAFLPKAEGPAVQEQFKGAIGNCTISLKNFKHTLIQPSHTSGDLSYRCTQA